MSFKETSIDSLEEYIDIVFSHEGDIIYRGVSDKEYALIPGIGRKLKGGWDREHTIIFESEMLSEFSEKVASIENCNNYTELVVLAQHYGLPTRLLDWTWNPLVSLYFSIKGSPDKDAAVYIANIENITRALASFDYSTIVYQGGSPMAKKLNESEEFSKLTIAESAYKYFESIQDGFNGIKFIAMTPKAKTQRVISQDSIFIIHVNPFIPFDEHILEKIIIKKELKKPFTYLLNKLGFHDFSMFPGCDGLCSYLKNKYLF